MSTSNVLLPDLSFPMNKGFLGWVKKLKSDFLTSLIFEKKTGKSDKKFQIANTKKGKSREDITFRVIPDKNIFTQV